MVMGALGVNQFPLDNIRVKGNCGQKMFMLTESRAPELSLCRHEFMHIIEK